MRVVVSGARPTGRQHLGNYHGALKNWVRLQGDYRCFFFVADWHVLTTDYARHDWTSTGLSSSSNRPCPSTRSWPSCSAC